MERNVIFISITLVHISYKSCRREANEVDTWFVERPFLVQLIVDSTISGISLNVSRSRAVNLNQNWRKIQVERFHSLENVGECVVLRLFYEHFSSEISKKGYITLFIIFYPLRNKHEIFNSINEQNRNWISFKQ
jgi:hypothetical protein